MRSGTPRTKLGRDLANIRHHGDPIQQELHEALYGGYQPLNPETFGKPAFKRLPFTPTPLDRWATTRKARDVAEALAEQSAIIPVSEPRTVRVELPIYRTTHFKVVYGEHWCEPRMCWEVQDLDGKHKRTFFGEEAAKLYANECELWLEVMAKAPTFNHALDAVAV